MPRGLDHIVHAVRDLDAAADLYRRLGFSVGARNRHPWGTHNHIVQLPGFFIELLTLAEPDKIGDDGFSRLFAAYNRDFVHGKKACRSLSWSRRTLTPTPPLFVQLALRGRTSCISSAKANGRTARP